MLIVRGLLAIIVTLLIAMAVGLDWLHQGGERLLSVQTASMVPTFRPGDALIVAPLGGHQPRPGQIISYRSPANHQVLISHRLVAIDPNTGWLTTAGDALGSRDQPFPPSLVAGRAVAIAPGLGTVLDFLHKPLGLAAAIYLPAAILISFEIAQLLKATQQPYYRISNYGINQRRELDSKIV